MRTETISERVAHNESAFREANERIESAVEEMTPEMALIPFICECPLEACTEITPLTREEYELVRSRGNTFLVAPGHEVLAVEGIEIAVLGEKYERFSRMEKVNEAGAISEQLDPRGDQ